MFPSAEVQRANMDNLPHSLDEQLFSAEAKEWLTDRYTVDIRYIAQATGHGNVLINGSMLFYAWMQEGLDHNDFEFEIVVGDLIVGQKILTNASLADLRKCIDNAIGGEIVVGTKIMKLPGTAPPHYLRSEPFDEWNNTLRIRISSMGVDTTAQRQAVLPNPLLDNKFRKARIPFDGLRDALRWLALPEATANDWRPSLDLMIYPPVALNTNESKFTNGKLSLVIELAEEAKTRNVGVSVAGSPHVGVSLRKQIGGDIDWPEHAKQSKRIGVAEIEVKNAHSAFVTLSYGSNYAQRHWLGDPSASKKIRYPAAQTFDSELRKIRKMLQSNDSPSFEKAVAAIFFLSGFAPFLPVEQEGPDIICITPGGQIIMVECTTKTTDAQSKIGNLVLRRNQLLENLRKGRHSNTVIAVLAVKCARADILETDGDLAQHDVLLWAKENLQAGLSAVQNRVDPDEIASAMSATINALKATPAPN